MPLTLVTPPTSSMEAVSLDDAKRQCKLEGVSYDDTYLQEVIVPAAIERAEVETLRQILTATYRLTLTDLPGDGWIELPKPPLASVLSITYVDGNGVTQTWAASNYLVTAPAGPRGARGSLSLAYGISWPTVRGQANAVAVNFVAGYGDEPSEIPALLRQAILLDVATLYWQRQNVVTGLSVAEIPGRSSDIYRAFRSYPSQVAVAV